MVEYSTPVRPVETGPGGSISPESKYRTRAESEFFWHAHLLWESRYVTEGRDNLAGQDIVSVSTELSIDNFNIIPWIADSPDADYSEFNLNIFYGAKVTKDLDIYAGYNHVQIRNSSVDSNDNEVSFDLVFKWLQRFRLFGSVYHSFDAKGSFVELAIKHGHPVDNKIHFNMKATLGINAGYIPDGHDGLNHFQIYANAIYRPVRRIDIYAYTGYNFAINRDSSRYSGDELLGDFLWGGAGFSYRF